MGIAFYLKTESKKIDQALEKFLPKNSDKLKHLNEAMHYAVLSGGKRIRPILVLAACKAVGGDEKKAMPAACALEFIHNYSLVHDDLPCMDDDDLRRGEPTVHKKFGEAAAVLAGDALLTAAFSILSVPAKNESSKELTRRIGAIHLIAEASGANGMVGGQDVDMLYKDKQLDLPTIEFINIYKTGALIAASTRVGALLGGGSSKQIDALYKYGKFLGVLFQIVDDILDKEGYAEVLGLSEASKEADRMLSLCKRELKPFGKRALELDNIAEFVRFRKV